MTAPHHIAEDLGKHLAIEIVRTLQRHARLMAVADLSTVQAAAAALAAAESFSIAAIGMMVLQVEKDQREDVISSTADRLANCLRGKAAQIIEMAEASEAMTAARRSAG